MSDDGKEFCIREGREFSASEFETIDDTLIHKRNQWHSALDGRIVTVTDGNVVFDDIDIEPAAPAPPHDQ